MMTMKTGTRMMLSELSFKKSIKKLFFCAKIILFSLRGKKEGLEKDFPRRGNLFLLKRHMIFKIKNEISLSGGKNLWAQSFFKNNFPKNFFSKTKLFLKSFDFIPKIFFPEKIKILKNVFLLQFAGFLWFLFPKILFLRTGKTNCRKRHRKNFFPCQNLERKNLFLQM